MAKIELVNLNEVKIPNDDLHRVIQGVDAQKLNFDRIAYLAQLIYRRYGIRIDKNRKIIKESK